MPLKYKKSEYTTLILVHCWGRTESPTKIKTPYNCNRWYSMAFCLRLILEVIEQLIKRSNNKLGNWSDRWPVALHAAARRRHRCASARRRDASLCQSLGGDCTRAASPSVATGYCFSTGSGKTTPSPSHHHHNPINTNSKKYSASTFVIPFIFIRTNIKFYT